MGAPPEDVRALDRIQSGGPWHKPPSWGHSWGARPGNRRSRCVPHQTLPSSRHVSHGYSSLTPSSSFFIFFPFEHQHWSQSTRRPNSAAVGLAQAHCAGSRAQLAADTQEQNLARPLPPSPQKGDERAESLSHRFCHSNPEPRAHRTQSEHTTSAARLRAEQPLGLALKHSSPARSSTPNAELFSASPETSRGTSRVSCWLAPTPCANPARPQLHAAVSGSAANPSDNEQLLSWAGVKIFQHPRLYCTTAIKTQMYLFSLLPPSLFFF